MEDGGGSNGFQRNQPPTSCEKCKNKCKERFEQRKKLIQSARDKAAKEGGDAGAKAKETADEFDKYNTAMPKAKAALAVYGGADPECLRRVTDPDELRKMGITDPKQLNDPNSGFHAEVYKSDWDDRTILAFQGTDRNSLNDWKTSIDNGDGLDTAQYKSARELAARMEGAGVDFDITGHSLGGGLAQEAGLVAGNSNVWTFNAAGLHEASLERTGNTSWDSLNSRTQAFRTQYDFVTFIQESRDPQMQLANARFLRNELANDTWGMSPIMIEGYNSEKAWTHQGRARTLTPYGHDRKAFVSQLDERINEAQSKVDKGIDPGLFPPAHGQNTEVPGWIDSYFKGERDEDKLGKLNQHLQETMITKMEEQKMKDEYKLKRYTGLI
ncbi:hypothetical protein [Sorangium sp. So ce394]|uniref:hypothetical protein n=1 Tax=Sorangium sp. So ce394 TaxID=3133310 RepID=UPI003F5C5137